MLMDKEELERGCKEHLDRRTIMNKSEGMKSMALRFPWWSSG